jgi:hypothetical protein
MDILKKNRTYTIDLKDILIVDIRLARRTSARGLSGAKPTVTGPLMTGNGLFGPMRPKSIDLTRMAVSGLGF